MSADFPSPSFPERVNPHSMHRELFADYGMFGHMYSDSSGDIVFQNKRTGNRFAATHPVLPLATTSEKVEYPFQDRVMGHIVNLNKKIKSFVQSVKCLRPRYTRVDSHWFDYVIQTHLEVADCLNKHVIHPDKILDCVSAANMSLLNTYMDICDAQTVMFTNSAYAGGSLGHLPHQDGGWGYIVSPGGQDFDTITVQSLHEGSAGSEGLLHGETLAEQQLEESILQIQSAAVQGQDLIACRTESEVQLYRLRPEKGRDMLHELCELRPESGKKIRSINFSPYIPGECLVTTEGACLMWAGEDEEELVPVYSPAPPDNAPFDLWCGGYYGSHPRQILYADLTRAQLVDLRISNSAAVELLSLPRADLHTNERIRVCQPLHASAPFHHLIGTDYSLLLMDERFYKHPVLHWDHMLTCPPQYFSVLPDMSPPDIVTYVGCQNPASVHGFTFTASGDKPSQSVTLPWRAAQMMDLSKWPQFTDNCANPLLLKKRMAASLAGVQAVNYGDRHAVIQMNCYGEIFHQVFRTTSGDDGDIDVTFSAGMGSRELTTTPEAAERGQAWVKDWEAFMRLNDKGLLVLQTNLYPLFEQMRELDDAHPECVVCFHSNHAETSIFEDSDDEDRDTKCEACKVHLKHGKHLVDSTDCNTLTAPDTHQESSPSPWSHLQEPSELPATNALTKLLVKHWENDDDTALLLKERTSEIRDKIKKLKDILSCQPGSAITEDSGSTSSQATHDNVDNLDNTAAAAAGKLTAKERRKAKRKAARLSKENNFDNSNKSVTGNKAEENEQELGSEVSLHSQLPYSSQLLSSSFSEPGGLDKDNDPATDDESSLHETSKKKKKSKKKKRHRTCSVSDNNISDMFHSDIVIRGDIRDTETAEQKGTGTDSPEKSSGKSQDKISINYRLHGSYENEGLNTPKVPPPSIFKTPFLSPLKKVSQVSTIERATHDDSDSSFNSSFMSLFESGKRRTDSEKSFVSSSITSSQDQSLSNLDESFDSEGESSQSTKKRKISSVSDSDSSIVSTPFSSGATLHKKKQKRKKKYTMGF